MNSDQPSTLRAQFEDEDSCVGNESTFTAGSYASTMDSQTQEAQEKYKRMMFEKGDEQTVNACLVALIMPVEWIFGRSGTVHLDREPQQLRGDDGELLYKACVDGVIAGTNSVTKSFIEVKRDLRGKDKGVRMQEGAQMAAFIFQDEQDLDNSKPRYGALAVLVQRQSDVTLCRKKWMIPSLLLPSMTSTMWITSRVGRLKSTMDS